MNIENQKIEPTFDKPETSHAEKFEKDFTEKTRRDNVYLDETDSLLNEKEHSFKKKIFDLAKMEALVHGDQQLSAIYNKMAEDGDEKYGYHYNETIMNLIFNEYVMNSAKFLQKYKMAVPKEKKRRDKSGIHQLQKSGQLDQRKQQMMQRPKTEGIEHNNSLPGTIEELNDETSGNFGITNGMGFDIERDGINQTELRYNTMEEPIVKEHCAENREEMINVILNLAPETHDMQTLQGLDDKTINDIYTSVEHQKLGVDETTGSASSGAFSPPLGTQRRAFAEGKEEKNLDETTTSASSGQYTGPFHKKTKQDKIDTPFWNGGEMIQESNYLTDPSGFKKYINEMDETALRTPGLKTPGLMEDDNNDLFSEYLSSLDPEMIGRLFNDLMANIKNNPLGSKHDVKPKFEIIKNMIQLMPDSKKAQLPLNVQNAIKDKSIWQKLGSFFGISEGGEDFNINANDQNTLQSLGQELKPDGINLELDEKAKSKNQQQFMGMVHATQKGELDNPSPTVAKVADSMNFDDVDDFASTKHVGLPEKVNEIDPIPGAEPTDDPYDGQKPNISYDDIKKFKSNPDFNNMEKAYANLLQYHWRDPNRDVQVLNKTLAYIRDTLSRISGLSDEQIQSFYETQNSRKGIETNPDFQGYSNESIIDQNTIADREGNTMAMKSNGSSVSSMGGADFGSDSVFENQIKENVSTRTACKRDEEPVAGVPINKTGGCKKKISTQDTEDASKNPHNLEARKKRMSKYEKELESKKSEYQIELEKHKKDMEKQKEKAQGKKSVSEDKKPSSLIMKDRLGKENEANFKADMGDSNTEMIKTKQDELSAMEQYEDVPTNPYELGEKIEKESLAINDGNAFKNMGNSTNEAGDEIPKRNLDSPEQKEVDMITQRQSDWVFDNKPPQSFEDRMKKDMGEDIYNQRQEKMKYKSNAPMYNKDAQPIQDSEVKKDQFDKQASTWNERDGVKKNKLNKIDDLMESMITGKYRDEFGNIKFVNFKINETVEGKANGIKLNLEGMGNSYTTKVNENAEMRNMMDVFEFYVNGKQVTRVKTGKQIMNESVKTKPQINEQAEKMKRLMGYDPSSHISTDNVKKNRNF